MQPDGASRVYALLLTAAQWAGFAIATACLLLAYLAELPALLPFVNLGLALTFGAPFVARLASIPVFTVQGWTVPLRAHYSAWPYGAGLRPTPRQLSLATALTVTYASDPYR